VELQIEAKAWLDCNPKHLWIFGKLIISRLSGHICGPRGIPVPKPGEYFVKPVVNIEGMGEKARKVYLEKNTVELLHPGEFLCEVFEGEHLSIDYTKYEPTLKVVGTKHKEKPYQRFAKWEKTDKWHPLPQFIGLIPLQYRTINCEFIGGKLIEIHLRGNPDFAYGNTSVIPAWKDEADPKPEGYRFISDEGTYVERAGIYVK
jgi:hypothetical protein